MSERRWTMERVAEADALMARGILGMRLAAELTRLWGWQVSPNSLKKARARFKQPAKARRIDQAATLGKEASASLTKRIDTERDAVSVSNGQPNEAADDTTGEFEPVFPEDEKAGPQPHLAPLAKPEATERSPVQIKREEHSVADRPDTSREDTVSLAPPTGNVHSHAPVTWTPATDRYLLISDLQIPFEHHGALAFCLAVQREYRISLDNIICVGDETDAYFGSMYAHDPDATHTPNSELSQAKDRLRRWYRAFPRVRVCNSNHGDRWLKKAANAQIPSQLLRAYREVIEAPEGWQWRDRWAIETKHPFDVEHGHHGAQGIHAHRQKAIDNGRSLAHGHLHASAGIAHIRTGDRAIWGLNAGCMIDVDAFAFHYGRAARFKPWLGVGVVLDDGATPLLVPYGVMR